MAKVGFEWDPQKDQENQKKHGVSFVKAQFAFADPSRVIAEDLSHSSSEKRYYCFRWVEGRVLTVRFTYRTDVIRILVSRQLPQSENNALLHLFTASEKQVRYAAAHYHLHSKSTSSLLDRLLNQYRVQHILLRARFHHILALPVFL